MNTPSGDAAGHQQIKDRLRIIVPIALIALVALAADALFSGNGAEAVADSSPVAEDSSVAEDSAPVEDNGSDDDADGPYTEADLECLEGATTKPTIAVRARGTTGDENALLIVTDPDGYAEVVTVPVGTSFDVFTYSLQAAGYSQSIRVEFTNDLYQGPQYDRNVTVDWIEVCGQRFETEAPTTESVGIWRSGEGCRPQRFGAGETLHCNGYFQFGADPTMPTMIDVVVRARGTAGEEILDVTTYERDLASFHLSTQYENYTFQVPGGTRVNEVRFGFNNDKFIRGVIDRNVLIDYIVFDGQRIDAEDARTYVGGLWNGHRCVSGNLQTEIIHCDGWFYFLNAPAGVS